MYQVHLHANQRRRKNHIASLQVDGVTLVSETDKAEAAFRYYEAILCSEVPRSVILDFFLNASSLISMSWVFPVWTYWI